MNKIILLGKIFDQPTGKITQNGQFLGKLTLKTSESFKDKNGETKWDNQFHRCTFWGSRWEKFFLILSEKKDSDLMVEGKITYSSFDKDGVKHYSTEIIVENAQLLK